MRRSGRPIKVAILGGGMASLAAAWELVRHPDGDDYEITIYQRDWRLGGKGASGRSLDALHGNRVEEHGIHVLPGFYENTFHLLRQVYHAVAQGPDASKILSWSEALSGSDDVVMADPVGKAWGLWKVRFPTNRRRIGGRPRRAGVPALFARGSRRYRQLRRKLLRSSPSPGLLTWTWGRDAVSAMIDLALLLLLGTALGRGRVAQRLAALLADWQRERLERDLLHAWQVVSRQLHLESIRRAWIAAWFVGTNVAGLLREGLLLPPRDFLRLDDQDYYEWLASRSAVPVPGAGQGRPPPVQALYDLAFSDAHTLAAGTTLWVILHMGLDYKGHFVYRMNGGMGDVVFAPLYLALAAKRNVHFRFYHEVERIVANQAGDAIAEIRIRQHFEQQGSPLVPIEVGGRELHCWPNCGPPGIEPVDPVKTLRAGCEFDVAVLGIGHGALRRLCPSLCANARFAAMLDGLESIPTQSLQLWLAPSLADLGWERGSSMLISFRRPFNSWTDMAHLLPHESWPRRAVGTLAYFSDELPRRDARGRDPEQTVRANARRFFEGPLRAIWPKLDYAHLYDPNGGCGPERLDFQYLRANVDESDHYVLCVKGSTRHRLAPGESGFSNLALAGDWVKTELNAGCLEAATLGGLGAARAILGGSVRATS
jgi:uncharacterized protein with NAD-binding domain and iron-sulfur cluster